MISDPFDDIAGPRTKPLGRPLVHTTLTIWISEEGALVTRGEDDESLVIAITEQEFCSDIAIEIDKSLFPALRAAMDRVEEPYSEDPASPQKLPE